MPVRPRRRTLLGLLLSVLVAACGGSSGATATSPVASAAPTASGPASAPPTGSPAATPVGSAMLGPTGGGLTLVEPLPALSAGDGSVDLTPAGSLVMLQSGVDLKLHSLDCATNCGDPATWSATTLEPGVSWAHPLIRARDDGSLVAVVDDSTAGQSGDVLGVCTADCAAAGSWTWSKIPLPPDATTMRAASRYFAVSGDAMILGLGSGSPMGALVCGGLCESAASWTRVKFSDAACSAPSVAASPSGAMAFACVTANPNMTPTESSEVWSCPGACTSQANWGGVTGLAAGDGLAVDVTVGPQGMVNAAVNLGNRADAANANRLGWFQCLGGCGEPASWHGIVVGSEVLYARRVAAVTDQQGRSVIAYDGTSSAGSGLLSAACVANCLKPGSWSVALLDDAKRVAAQIPVPAPQGCESAVWVPDNVTDIAMRGDWGAVTSGYSAIGAGGTCPASPFPPSSALQPIRSVVSVAILGP